MTAFCETIHHPKDHENRPNLDGSTGNLTSLMSDDPPETWLQTPSTGDKQTNRTGKSRENITTTLE